MKSSFLMFIFVFFSLIHFSLKAGNAVWWEGEDCIKTDFNQAEYLNTVKYPTRLSNMKWLNCHIPKNGDKTKKTFSAEYEVTVPETSEYTFWAREFFKPRACPWKFKFDDGEWVESQKFTEYKDSTDLDSSRRVVWCQYGKIKLSKGTHKLEIQISEKANSEGFASGFDCFLLTDVPFEPKSWKKPKVLSKYGYIGTYIWLEGEKADEKDFINDMPEFPKKSPALSDNKWLICATDPEKLPGKGFISKWKFTIPMTGTYNFWTRKFTDKLSSPFEYRFVHAESKGEWIKVSNSIPSFDSSAIDDKTTVSWINLKTGKGTNHYLREGANTLEIRVSKPNKDGNIRLAIDCICISLEPFTPMGQVKPDTKITPRNGWLTFNTSEIADTTEKNRFSLAYLNEEKSGSNGFCKVDPKKGLVFGNSGKRAKFWGINAFEQMKMDPISVNDFVKEMASLGVNLIRVEGPLCNPDQKEFGKIDAFIFNKLCYFIKVCRDNGVYVALANYNAEDYLLDAKSEFEGFKKPGKPYGMLYINTEFRKKYKKWARFLLRQNKYTNVRLFRDPTIVWFEIENGKGLLSDAFREIPKEQIKKLEVEYNQWLIQRYGGIQGILQNWSIPHKYHPVVEKDKVRSSKPHLTLLTPDSFDPKVLKGRRTDFLNKRKADQMRFLVEYCRNINTELIKYLREECRFKGLISVGNSKVESEKTLRPVMDYINSSGDILARTSMFDAKVLNNVNTLAGKVFFHDRSAVKNPLASPVIKPIFPGKANVTTEVSWPLPNRYRAEAVPFVAAYSALHGSDIYIWYTADSPSWATRLKKYTIQSPAVMGQFPAAALMFRRGDVSQGSTLVKKQINVNDIIELKGNGFDTEDYKDNITLHSVDNEKGQTNPLSCLAGRVEYVYDEKRSADLKSKDLGKFYNRSKGYVKSTTGELTLNFKKGYLKIDTPKTQGVTGFFQKDIVNKLKNIDILIENEYATVIVTSMDNKALAESKHILIQCFADDSNYQWKVEDVPGRKGLKTIANIGDSPVVIKEMKGSVVFPGIKSKGWKIWKLDINGKRTFALESKDPNSLTVPLESDAMHIELIKE